MIKSKTISRLFTYDDYRLFLSDYIRECNEHVKRFSLRKFSMKCGFSSHSFLRFVIDGKRNLSEKSIGSIADVLELGVNQKRFFASLVQFCQSSDHAEKSRQYHQMNSLRTVLNAHVVESEESVFYEKWYYPVIKELAVSVQWAGNYRILGKMVVPSLTAFEVKEAIEFLLVSKLLQRDEKGTYFSTKEHLNSHAVEVYRKKIARREVLELGVESVERFGPNQRHTAYTTLALDADAYNDIAAMFDEFRESVIQRAAQSGKGDVYEAVLQLFPVTNIKNSIKE